MTRRILTDYFAAFRWGKVKEGLKGNGFLVLYVLLISPFIFSDVLESVQRGTAYYLTLLPFMFAVLSARLHPMTLPKLMYLVPMSGRERRVYIRRAYCLNIMIPVLLGILCQGILLLNGWIGAIMASVVVAEIFLTALLFGITGCVTEGWDERRNRKDTIKEIRRWGLIAEIVTFVLLHLLSVYCVGMAEKGTQCMVIVSILLFQLPLVLMVMRGYPQAEEMAVNYEQIQK